MFSLQKKIIITLLIVGLIATTLFSVYRYRSDMNSAKGKAKETATSLIKRSAEMFMVSTRKFHDDFKKNLKDPDARKIILDDWNRTIFAVDQAVIADHGEGQPRVRLIGDEEIFQYRPIGDEAIAPRSPFEFEAAKALMNGEPIVEKIEDNTFKIAFPLSSAIHPGCAECHIANIEGFDADFDQKILLGSLNAYVPMDETIKQARINTATSISVFLLTIAAILITSFITVKKLVLKPIGDVTSIIKDISEGEGDLTQRINIERNDEIGALSNAFNHFIAQLNDIIKKIVDNANHLTQTSSEVVTGSDQLADNAKDLTEQATEVTSSAERVTMGINSIANSTDEMAENAKSVAIAVEEMSSTISEVTKSCNRATEVANEANEMANKSAQSVEILGKAANEITHVIEVVNDISNQTNLLALNATIEAASAGEAGKGFAVVANEVKELAKQTNDATVSISDKVSAIQNSTDEAVRSINAINRIVGDINEISNVIASAMEEQSITTNEVSSKVMESAQSTEAVSDNINDSATSTNDIVNRIKTISEAATNSSEGAEKNKNAGHHLDSLSSELHDLIRKFKV